MDISHQLILSNEEIEQIIDQSFNDKINTATSHAIQKCLHSQYMKMIGQEEFEQETGQNENQVVAFLIEKMNDLMDRHSQQVTDLQKQHEEKTQKNKSIYTKQLVELQKNVQCLQKQNKKLKASLKTNIRLLQNEKQKTLSLEKSIGNIEQSKNALQKKLSKKNQQIEKYMYQQTMMKKQMENEAQELWKILEESMIQLKITSNVTQMKLIEMMQLESEKEKEIQEKQRKLEEKQKQIFEFLNQISSRKMPEIEEETEEMKKEVDDEENGQKYKDVFENLKQFVEKKLKQLRKNQIKLTKQSEDLKKRYTTFLQETEQKILQLKQKNSNLEEKLKVSESSFENQIKSLKISNEENNKKIISKDEKISTLSERISQLDNLLYEKQEKLEEKCKIIQENEIKLDENSEKLNKLEEEMQGKERQMQQLKIELISVKEALQTLKSMKLQQETLCDDESSTASIIMDQMVDKTYHIRLENLEFRSEIEQLHLEITELSRHQKQKQAQFQQKQFEHMNLLQSVSSIYEDLNLKNEEINCLRKQLEEMNRRSNTPSCRKVGIKRNIKRDESNSKQNNNSLSNSLLQASSIELSESVCRRQKPVFSQKSHNLTKTFKFQQKNEKYLKSINNLNEIVNYMVNYAKGYTRNGVRKQCWITGQGDSEYITRVMNGMNMKQKYENFEKVRELCQEDSNCKELINNYERIINYYLVRI